MNLKYLYKMLLKTRFLNLRIIINNLLVANYIKNLRKKKINLEETYREVECVIPSPIKMGNQRNFT